MNSFIRTPALPFSELAQKRQQQAFRERVSRWVLDALSSLAGLSDANINDVYESPDGDGYRFVVDELSGERFFIHVRSNGSIQCELGLPWESASTEDAGREIVKQMAEIISTLYHDDVLKFSHALYSEAEGFLLRSIASIDSTPDLMSLVAEGLVLTDLLMDLLADAQKRLPPDMRAAESSLFSDLSAPVTYSDSASVVAVSGVPGNTSAPGT